MSRYIQIGLVIASVVANTGGANGTAAIGEVGYGDFVRGTLRGVALDQSGTLNVAPSVREVAVLEDAVVWAAAADGAGGLWLSVGEDNRLLHMGADGTVSERFRTGAAVGAGLAVAADGTVYLGAGPEAVVYRMEAGAERPEVYVRLEAEYIWDMAIADNTLWIATGVPAGLQRVDLATGERTVVFEPKERHIMRLRIAGDWVWLGSAGSGTVYRVARETQRSEAFFVARQAELLGLEIDAAGNLWVAGFGEGEMQAPSREAAQAAFERSLGLRGDEGGEREAPQAQTVGVLYQVTPEGYGLPVWQSSKGGILSLARLSDRYWLLGIDSGGTVYGVSGRDEWERFVDLERGGAVVSLLPADAGAYWLVSSRPGVVYRLGGRATEAGTYTSTVLDAQQTVGFGQIEIVVEGEGSVEVETRSGSVKEPDATWSAWQTVATAMEGGALRGAVASPAGRFLQYRLKLQDGELGTIAVHRVRTFVRLSNAPPVVTRLVNRDGIYEPQVLPNAVRPVPFKEFLSAPRGGDGAERLQFMPTLEARGRTLAWEAQDANGDEMVYAVYLRKLGAAERVVLERALDVSYVAISTEGWEAGYYRFEVEAADPLGAVGVRESAPFLVDHAVPEVAVTQADGRLSVEVSDTWSVVQAVRVRFGGGEAEILQPVDGLYDQTRERFSVALPEGFVAGEGQLTATDERGNTARVVF